MNTSDRSAALRFASALSTHSDTGEAVAEVCQRANEQLGAVADLAMLFVSQHHGPDFERIAAAVCQRLGSESLLGCTGESIVGVGREVEAAPAMSLWLARLPGVTIAPMHLQFERSPEGGVIVGWPDDLPAEWPAGAALLMLGEPFSFPADALLERLNEDQPGTPVIGGMASGGAAPGENCLLLGRAAPREGAVAVMLYGPLRLRTIVSQGCRPIGTHFVITKAERNVIYELGGKPALLRLKEIFDTLPTHEQQLVQQGLHVGRVVSEYQDRFQQGDFLVRNVMGIDPDNGAIAIGDYVRAGQTVQFHIRDQQSADEELRQLLAAVHNDATSSPDGALLFTCNGRGTRLFSQSDHDARVLQDVLGNIPLAGFFAAGELGPIGGKNFMHGFTASVALFENAEC
jgi:small ligand-binding sensory domain FIST